MTSKLDISIPTAANSSTPKPYTIYTISLRQPLRSHHVEKRYSDFVSFHSSLTSQAEGIPPPAPLPQKTYFKSTVTNPVLAEERRQGLETYLRAINQSADPRWRSTHAWRSFLNLLGPGGAGSDSNAGVSSSAAFRAGPISDPSIWLDVYGDLKSQLRDARHHLTRRDQATTTKEQHEAGAESKAATVKSGSMITQLEQSLDEISGKSKDTAYEGPRLGDGEIQRRKDLLNVARKDKNSIESQINAPRPRPSAFASKSEDAASSSRSQEGGLNRTGSGFQSSRRVLGGPIPETDQTRELNNTEVVQLQKQIMQQQDEDVGGLTKVIRRMKEMGIQINEELTAQDELIDILGQDVDRVDGKVKVAKKRINQIS